MCVCVCVCLCRLLQLHTINEVWGRTFIGQFCEFAKIKLRSRALVTLKAIAVFLDLCVAKSVA